MSRGKRPLDEVSDSDYSDNFDEESDTESTSSHNGKISTISAKKRFRRNSSELNQYFQNNAIYSKMAGSETFQNDKIQRGRNPDSTAGKRNRCFSKNAINARENRIRKKLYVENLEKTVEKYRIKNRQLTLLLENQTNMLSDMKKEVSYFKSVLANSKDISRLIKCLNQNTGMPVTTSINKNISANIIHPWAENNKTSSSESLENSELNENSEFNLPLDSFLSESLNFEDSLKLPDDIFQSEELNGDLNLHINDEHNYNAKSPDSFTIEDVGVCLHISNHKMSLEFCSTCSDKASSSWK